MKIVDCQNWGLGKWTEKQLKNGILGCWRTPLVLPITMRCLSLLPSGTNTIVNV